MISHITFVFFFLPPNTSENHRLSPKTRSLMTVKGFSFFLIGRGFLLILFHVSWNLLGEGGGSQVDFFSPPVVRGVGYGRGVWDIQGRWVLPGKGGGAGDAWDGREGGRVGLSA